MAPVALGSNLMFEVPFPLVIEDRFFSVAEGDGGQMVVSVFRWDPVERRAVDEVVANEPLEAAGVTTNPTGRVTWTREDGGFAYKFRPGSSTSVIFGRTEVAAPDQDPLPIVVHFRDRDIRITRGETDVARFGDNIIQGAMIGLLVTGTRVAMGANQLPPGLVVSHGHDAAGRAIIAHQHIKVADLVTVGQPVVEHVRFLDCVLLGPAIVLADGLGIVGSRLPSHDGGYFPIPAERLVQGPVVMRDCVIENSAFEGVGLMGPEELIEEIRASGRPVN